MNKIDFTIQNDQPLTNDFVMIQAGKGKTRETIIYLNGVGFSYLEGLIWDKYREYGNELETKIKSAEWTRIIEGFSSALEKIRTSDGSNLKKILKFGIINPSRSLEDVQDQLEDLMQYIEQFTLWLMKHTKTQKYVMIDKHNA